MTARTDRGTGQESAYRGEQSIPDHKRQGSDRQHRQEHWRAERSQGNRACQIKDGRAVTTSTHRTGDRSVYRAQQSLPGHRKAWLDLAEQTGLLLRRVSK